MCEKNQFTHNYIHKMITVIYQKRLLCVPQLTKLHASYLHNILKTIIHHFTFLTIMRNRIVHACLNLPPKQYL